MAYDPLAESRKMLADGVPPVTFRLSRRRRFLPVAFDVDGDAAATLFIRRGVSGDPWLESWTLVRRDGEWKLLGGGSGNGHDDLFEPRPPIYELEAPTRLLGSGATDSNANRKMPWGRKLIHTAQLRCAAEVERLDLGGRRIAVQDHGVVTLVWTQRRAPRCLAVAGTGEIVGEVPLRHEW